MHSPREIWSFNTRHIGKRVEVYSELPSTNDRAAQLAADPDNAGTVIITDSQSAGRGQYGRVWQAPAGTALLASVLLNPPPAARRPVALTALAAVAVCEAIRETTGLQARVKWPNDLLLGGKKVCGILIEQGHGTVIGFGLNVNQSATDFAAAHLQGATSLAEATGNGFDVAAILRVIVGKLDDEYDRILAGEWTALEADWKWRIGLLGRQVSAELLDGSIVPGRLRDMSFDRIEIETGEAAFSVLRPELIRQLRPV